MGTALNGWNRYQDALRVGSPRGQRVTRAELEGVVQALNGGAGDIDTDGEVDALVRIDNHMRLHANVQTTEATLFLRRYIADRRLDVSTHPARTTVPNNHLRDVALTYVTPLEGPNLIGIPPDDGSPTLPGARPCLIQTIASSSTRSMLANVVSRTEAMHSAGRGSATYRVRGVYEIYEVTTPPGAERRIIGYALWSTAKNDSSTGTTHYGRVTVVSPSGQIVHTLSDSSATPIAMFRADHDRDPGL